MAFHRALVDAAGNPVISYQLAGAVEAMQPLMNMIMFSARSRETIVGFHSQITDALEQRDGATVDLQLSALADYANTLAQSVIDARQVAKANS